MIFKKLEPFFDIQITQNQINCQLQLLQLFYIDKINKKFNIKIKHKIYIFLLIKTIHYYLNILLLQNTHLYQQLIKSINFITIIIKLNIAFVVLILLKHLTNLLQHHIKLAHKIIYYFNQTKLYLILFDPKVLCLIKNFGFSNNVSYTNDSNTCKNTQNYIFILFNKSID